MIPSPKCLVSFFIGAVFCFAGGMKILNPSAFFYDLLDYGIVCPELFLRVVAVSLPWLEVFSGLGLILNIWPETIRPTVSALCLIFVSMLGQAVVRGLDLRCGCFGTDGHGWFDRPVFALGRAVLLFAGSVYIMASPLGPTPNSATSTGPDPGQ